MDVTSRGLRNCADLSLDKSGSSCPNDGRADNNAHLPARRDYCYAGVLWWKTMCCNFMGWCSLGSHVSCSFAFKQPTGTPTPLLLIMLWNSTSSDGCCNATCGKIVIQPMLQRYAKTSFLVSTNTIVILWRDISHDSGPHGAFKHRFASSSSLLVSTRGCCYKNPPVWTWTEGMETFWGTGWMRRSRKTIIWIRILSKYLSLVIICWYSKQTWQVQGTSPPTPHRWHASALYPLTVHHSTNPALELTPHILIHSQCSTQCFPYLFYYCSTCLICQG